MSHLHIPDGLLPVWLWVSGIVLAGAVVLLALFMLRGMDLRRKVPMLGMMSAMMLVGMNIEIAPYHVNLSVITGIMLGPWMAIIASLIVNVLLSLVGHGGVTVVGLNTLVIASEAIAGWALFRVLKQGLSPAAAAGVSTVIALFMSTCIMLFIVYIANVDFSHVTNEHIVEVLRSPTVGALATTFGLKQGFDFRLFAFAALTLGFIGWIVEALITAVAVRFISVVKPELIR
jgi:cobalt/nickel transport system permease protein